MRRNKLFICIVAAITLVTGFQSCNIDPEYYTEAAPDTFFDLQEKVYQRFYRPFSHWASNSHTPRSGFTAAQSLSCDEFVMPNRNGDWYDAGFYEVLYNHEFSPGTSGYWDYTWDAFSMGVAQCWSALEDIDKYVDFDALGFPAGTRDDMLYQLKALVAHFYTIGLDGFGGVPLYLSNQGEAQARATDLETFDFIENLLKETLPNLPKKVSGDTRQGHITQGVAATMLARLYFNAIVYIKKDMFSECAKVCEDIKNGVYGSYALANRFQDIWGFGNENCTELIWAIPSEKGKREVSGNNLEHASHYNTWMYLDNEAAMSWNGFCLVPSRDIDGKNYRTETGKLGGPFKLGSPYEKYEDNDLRKKNYLYLGDDEYEGMFLAGKLINRLTGAACLADGSREYTKGDTVAMVDQIAQLAPDPVDADGNPLIDTVQFIDGKPNPDYGKVKEKYPNGRGEGFMFAEENSGVRMLKFSPIPNKADNSHQFNPDKPIFRLTETQYMLAECKFRQGDKAAAATLINEVRARYFAPGSPDPNPVPNDFDEYRLLDEWLIEFIGEGRRRTDLVRWDKYTTEAWWDHPADGPSKAYLNRFPISAGKISANSKLEQNPGYSK
jgi:hypothetical protein